MLYTSPDLFIAEIITVITGFIFNYELAEGRRRSWWWYFGCCIAMVYLMWYKESWVTVINQSAMAVLAIKNYLLFDKQESDWHKRFDYASIGVYLLSLLAVQTWNGSSISEVILWGLIIGRTILWGKKEIKGWYWLILQQLMSIVFGLYRGIYLYIFTSILQLFQGIYGWWKWKKDEAIVSKE